MKVRHNLARRLDAAAACAKLDRAWTAQFFPVGWLHSFPLQGRCVAMRPDPVRHKDKQ